MMLLGADWEEVDTTDKHEDNQISEQPLELHGVARIHFYKAAEAGEPLAREWLARPPHAKEE